MPDSTPAEIAASLLAALRSRTSVMVDQLAALVSAETPSSDSAACAAGAQVVRQIAAEVIGDPGEEVRADGRTHLRWRWPAGEGRRPVALIGHVDTVWQAGTLRRWPVSVGPGGRHTDRPRLLRHEGGPHPAAARGQRAG